MFLQLGLESFYWTAVNHFFIWASMAIYFVTTFTLYSNGMFFIFTTMFPFIGEYLLHLLRCRLVHWPFHYVLSAFGTSGTARNSLNQPNAWLTIFLTIIICVLPVVALRFVQILLWPTINDKVGEHAAQNAT